MKLNKGSWNFRLVVLVVSSLTFSFFLRVGSVVAATSGNLDGLVVTLQRDKPSFILGEPVSLVFRVTNQSDRPIELPNVVDVLGGGVRLQVAFEDGPYREYRGPMWGAVNRRGSQVLASGKSIETAATVLHNRAPKRGDLNETYWKRVVNEQIDTEIALSKPGQYRLKAILFGTIQSAPLEIYVGESQKIDDIELWKIISAEPDYALFMQSGSVFRGKITDQRTKEFVDAVENLVNYYPTSTYASHFRAAIAKHRASVEKVKAATAK
jgi:hypothetical protein